MTIMGVAISTTGDLHRLGFLEDAVRRWGRVLPLGCPLFVTVDGDEDAAARARVASSAAQVIRVGQPTEPGRTREGRCGVATNKNTGIEALMNAGVEHLFLSDDDTGPTTRRALELHVGMAEQGIGHSMVCWGASRNPVAHAGYASWDHPRGVLLAATSAVIERVGGMVEEFGPGGHEHVEWSRRIHNTGFTPTPFPTPLVYMEGGPAGYATGAGIYWACEDMRRPKEHLAVLGRRRDAATSVRREPGDWDRINALLNERVGDTRFVPYTAAANGRESATVTTTS